VPASAPAADQLVLPPFERRAARRSRRSSQLEPAEEGDATLACVKPQELGSVKPLAVRGQRGDGAVRASPDATDSPSVRDSPSDMAD
jgi:hypothetical protein